MRNDPLQQAARPQSERPAQQPAAEPARRDFVDRLGDFIERNNAPGSQKWGAGHVAAMWRSGLKELAQALVALPDGIRPVEEPGLAGNPTNIEVVNAKEQAIEPIKAEPLQTQVKGAAVEPAREASMLDYLRQRQVEPSPERGMSR